MKLFKAINTGLIKKAADISLITLAVISVGSYTVATNELIANEKQTSIETDVSQVAWDIKDDYSHHKYYGILNDKYVIPTDEELNILKRYQDIDISITGDAKYYCVTGTTTYLFKEYTSSVVVDNMGDITEKECSL